MDLDIAIGDNDAVNEEFAQLAALSEGGVRKAWAYPLAERLNGAHDLCDDLALVHLGLQLLALSLERAELVVQRLTTSAVLRERHRSRLVGIPYPLPLAQKVVDSLLQLGAARLPLLRQPRSCLCPLERLGKAGWVCEYVAQILPDELIQRLGWDVAGRTAAVGMLWASLRFAGAQIRRVVIRVAWR
jgi:hypothetical protein